MSVRLKCQTLGQHKSKPMYIFYMPYFVVKTDTEPQRAKNRNVPDHTLTARSISQTLVSKISRPYQYNAPPPKLLMHFSMEILPIFRTLSFFSRFIQYSSRIKFLNEFSRAKIKFSIDFSENFAPQGKFFEN